MNIIRHYPTFVKKKKCRSKNIPTVSHEAISVVCFFTVLHR